MELLISARDPAAAGNVMHIARAAGAKSGFRVHLVAAQPSYDILSRAGVPVRSVASPATTVPTDARARAVLAEAEDLLASIKPEALLVGLSRPGEGGIDEALLACATTPYTYAVQDFWGDVNGFFGKTAALYFVPDEDAAALTGRLHGVRTAVAGSPKHAAYRELDIPALRRACRERLRLSAAVPVIGYFGQGLWEMDGYRATVVAFGQAVARVRPRPALVYRPHPRESREGVEGTVGVFQAAGLSCHVATEGAVEGWLAGCDVACAAFSNAVYDAVYLNRFASAPLLTAVYLLFNPELKRYFRRTSGLDNVPLVRRGLAVGVGTASELEATLNHAVSGQAQAEVWARARASLPDPADAAATILSTIEREVAASGRRAEGGSG